MLKICRKYLTHVQESVFEGFLTYKQLEDLKNTLAKAIDTKSDKVTIYKYIKGPLPEKDEIGYHLSTDNII